MIDDDGIELTVTEFKQELEKLEAQGLGDYVVCIGFDGNSLYTTATGEGIQIDKKRKEVYFQTDVVI